MKLYEEFADWWPVMSIPEDYEEEARLYREIIEKYKKGIETALELGSGGGNNASHLKKHYQLTLTDLSPQMLEVSRKLNPECEHIQGDMREIELNRQFDLVFIHDAISYITTEEELTKIFRVANNHLKKDGLLFIAPDFFKETFKPTTDHGGHDIGNRSLRYLECTRDEDPNDNLVEVEYVYLLKEEGTQIIVKHDPTINGIFSKATWKRLLEEEGFAVHFEVIPHSELEPDSYFGIICLK